MAEPHDETKIVAEAQRLEEDTLYSGKGHLAAAGLYSRVHFWLGLFATVCSLVAATSIFADAKSVAVGLSTAAAVLTGLITFMKAEELAAKHRDSGNRYLSLRNKARFFRELGVRGSADAVVELRTLCDARDTLNEESTQIPGWAYWIAKRGIEAGEAKHAVDAK